MHSTFTSSPPLVSTPFAVENTPMILDHYLDRLPIQRLGKQLFLPVSRVVWIGTQYRMVYAFTEEQRHALDFGLDELSARLDPTNFFRIHRSTIVNLNKIAKIVNLGDGRCKLIMSDKAASEIIVSRYRAMDFKKAFNRCARLRDEAAFAC